MSAVITQLSYNINEKLCIDDRNYAAYQQRNKQQNQCTSASTTPTSFSYPSKDPCTQWTPSVSPSPGAFATQSVTGQPASSTSLTSVEKNLGSSGAVVGVAQRLAQRTSVLTRREAKSTNIRKSHKVADNIQVDLFDLQDTKANKVAGSTLPATLSSPQIDLRKSAKALKGSTLCDDDIVLYRDPASGDAKADAFPSVVGVGCTLHSPKKPPVAAAAVAVSGIPPNKRHCRSVSEPDDLFPASATSLCPISTSNAWRPANHSRVWMPIRQLRSGRRVLSAYSNASSVVDGSRSLDCSSSASCHGDPLLTPPASPVPRPASVTVIKQESGSWTFLSSQHPVPCYQQIVFSPVASPGGNVTSPASVRSTDGRMGGAWSNGGLSATKRSLSFSDDFERTESIHYTPSSTPELNRRFERSVTRSGGGLLRCQSHPSDLNTRRTRRRNYGRPCHHRPALDFTKMKQTSILKRSKAMKSEGAARNETDATKRTGMWPSISSSIGNTTCKSLFATSVTSSVCADPDCGGDQPEHSESASPPFSFPVASANLGHLRDVRGRIPSPTDEAAIETDEPLGDMDTVGPEAGADLATVSGGVQSSFVPECTDLDVAEIENESDCDA